MSGDCDLCGNYGHVENECPFYNLDGTLRSSSTNEHPAAPPSIDDLMEWLVVGLQQHRKCMASMSAGNTSMIALHNQIIEEYKTAIVVVSGYIQSKRS